MQAEVNVAAGQPDPTVQTPPSHQAPGGLGPLHVAVLMNDVHQVRQLLASREHGVDERSSDGATPLMLAGLFGRNTIFFTLVDEHASLHKQDDNGCTVMDYLKHMPPTTKILEQVQDLTGKRPSRRGRKSIYNIVRGISRLENQKSGDKSVDVTPVAPAAPAAPEAPEASEARTVFLYNDKTFEVCQTQRLAYAEFEIDIGRKVCGAIRGKFDREFRMMAISGWLGDRAKGVLDNRIYSSFVRRFCAEYGFRLDPYYIDHAFKGDPTEQVGAYHSCHTEKQLGIWILEESLLHAFGSRALISGNIKQLPGLVDRLPDFLRESVIELNHNPCKNCVFFLQFIKDKTGLKIQVQPRQWFTKGTRPTVRRFDGTRVIGSAKDEDTFQNEIDGGDEAHDWVVPQAGLNADNAVLVEQASNSASYPRDGPDDGDMLVDSDLIVLSPPSSQARPPLPRRGIKEQRTQPGAYSKHASPILEWPPAAIALRAKQLKTVSSKRRRALRTSKYHGNARKLPSSETNTMTLSMSDSATPSSSETLAGIRRVSISIPIKCLPSEGETAMVDEAVVDEAVVDEAVVDEAVVDEAVVDEAAVDEDEPFPGATGTGWFETFSYQG